MTVSLCVNDLNHPDSLFTLRWIFLWFLDGGFQTKIDLLSLFQSHFLHWPIHERCSIGVSLIPWSVTGWAGVAFFHRAMCLLQWLFGPTDVHLRTFVTACLCQGYSSSGWTSLCPQKKNSSETFIKMENWFSFCALLLSNSSSSGQEDSDV